MATQINNRRDILLLLLYSPGKTSQVNEAIVGRTRIVKMLFLFAKEALSHFRHNTDINEGNFYQFFPWDFGPFSSQAYDDITFFTLYGFVQSDTAEGEEVLPESAEEWQKWFDEQGAESDDEVETFEEEKFTLTTKGVDFTKPMYDSLTSAQKTLLKEFKGRLVATPLRAILRYVYTTYGEMTTKSKIRGEVLGND